MIYELIRTSTDLISGQVSKAIQAAAGNSLISEYKENGKYANRPISFIDLLIFNVCHKHRSYRQRCCDTKTILIQTYIF